MAANIEHWVEESIRKGEKVVVIIRNETTGEEVETAMNPIFIALTTVNREVKKGGDHNDNMEHRTR